MSVVFSELFDLETHSNTINKINRSRYYGNKALQRRATRVSEVFAEN